MVSPAGSKRQVVILAGGLGTRLRPITEKIPKPMVDVCGQPFLHWQLLDLKRQGYTRVLLLVAYLGEQVKAHFGDGAKLGMQLSYSFEPEPMGTGGALKHALTNLDESFILLNGDSFLSAPLAKMEASFDATKAVAAPLMAAISTYAEHTLVPVIPNLKVAGDRVVDYKKDAGLTLGFDQIDSGIYIVEKRLLKEKTETRFALADLWPKLIESKQLGAFRIDERFYDIGTVERLKEFERKLRDYFPNSISN